MHFSKYQIAAVVCVLLFLIGVPLALLLGGHITEWKQVEKVVTKAPMSFQECVAQATKSFGDDAIAAGRLKLAGSCLQVRDEAPVSKPHTNKVKGIEKLRREITRKRRPIRREREVSEQERQEGVEELARKHKDFIEELVAQNHQNVRKMTALLRDGLRLREYCDVLSIGRRTLRDVQKFNQTVRDLSLNDSQISDDELRAILKTAEERCR